MNPKWLDWTLRLQAIAQDGLAFCKDPFDIERYHQVREVAAQMLAERTEHDPEKILDLFISEEGYATPKLDVRGAVFVQDRILLVLEHSDGLWTLPGGWVDVGDSPSEAVEREVLEESGYETRAVKLAALFDRNKHDHPPLAYHIYKLFFICEITGGSPTTSLETDDVRFFAEDDLPNLSTTRITAGQMHRLFEHHRNPQLPTDFD